MSHVLVLVVHSTEYNARYNIGAIPPPIPPVQDVERASRAVGLF
jgi:hypothetical protein